MVNAQDDGRLRQAQLKMLAMLYAIDSVCQKHNLDYWLEGGTLLGAVRHRGFIPWDDDLDIAMPRNHFETFIQIAPTALPDSMWLQTPRTDPGYFNLSVPLKIRDRNSLCIEMHERGDEPYQQGIFIDVFVYDTMPANAIRRNVYKFLAKKIQRLLSPKCSAVPMGHYARCYKILGRFVTKHWLEKTLQRIIHRANSGNQAHGSSLSMPYLGYGFDCVNSNCIPYDAIYPLRRMVFETGEFNVAHRAELMLTQQYGNYLEMPPQCDRVMKHCRVLTPYLQ